jgi:ribosomal protein S18 acetylase RimI-like enzyme
VGAPLAGTLSEDELGDLLARSGVESRRATREDLDFAFAALRASMRAYVAAAYGAWDDGHQRALFAPSFDLRTHRVLRAEGRDVGILAVEPHVDRIHLARIFLLPGAQGRGLGGRVLGVLLDASHARGLPVALTVLHANPRARSFYERLGFRAVGETPTHVHLESDPGAGSLAAHRTPA